MVTWHLVMIFILCIIPILIGAKYRSMGKKNEKYFGIGNSIQTAAIISACFLIVADISNVYYFFYIALGVVVIIYIITYAYIYKNFLKK